MSAHSPLSLSVFFFFYNDPATTEIYTLSLHDALPIYTEVIVHLYEDFGEDCIHHLRGMFGLAVWDARQRRLFVARDRLDRKSTRLNSSHMSISYAVFCLKKKKKKKHKHNIRTNNPQHK